MCIVFMVHVGKGMRVEEMGNSVVELLDRNVSPATAFFLKRGGGGGLMKKFIRYHSLFTCLFPALCCCNAHPVY